MSGSKLIFRIGGIILAGLGVGMALTNPGQKAYEQYASETLNDYLKENVCTRVPSELSQFLESQCYFLVDTARPQLSQIIARNTKRQNFIVFSLYQTDLFIPSALPNYQVKTVGVFQNFYTYEAEGL
ncbi:DUF4359 domain-containing protein [Pleurocapsales cyanobacterium LEGE 06147]|nr:DUF4359 domain-containing protein [Pleurocapsales cyanobacterium LEGE 06147]